MLKRLILGLVLLLAPLAAAAQTYPPPSLPLTGNEVTPCIQNGGYKNCTTGEIGGTNPGALAITRAQIPTTKIGPGRTITLSGYAAVNDLGQGAVYQSNNCTSAGIGAIQDAGGTWLCLSFPFKTVNPGWFGAKGDNGATTISSGDIAAHPEWRGTYVAGDTWDTVGVNEAFYAAYAVGSTPGHIVWNAPSANASNSRYYLPTATYGINEPLFWVASFIDYDAATNAACLNWIGASTSTMLTSDSFAYGHINNLCLANAVRNHLTLTFPPIWIMDHDGSAPAGTLSTQQLYIQNCQIDVTGQGQNGVSLNPVGGNNAQGSVIGFHHCEFNGNATAQYAFRNNGDNAISNLCDQCDFIGFVQDTIQNTGGASFDVDHSTVESEGLVYGNFFFSPMDNQLVRFGWDFHSNGFVTSNVSRIGIGRSEGDAGVFCAGGGCTADRSYQLVGADFGNWTANSETQVGFPVNPSNNPGNAFVVAATGGPTNGNTSIGWRNIATTSTKCRVDDNGPGSTGWSNGQWNGYGVFERFTSGSTFAPSSGAAVPILWNTATQVSWCMETNSQLAGTAGNPIVLTVNSISQGGNNIAVNDSVLDAHGNSYGTITSQSGGTAGGPGTYVMSFSTPTGQLLTIGTASVTGQIAGTVLTVTKVHSGTIGVGNTIVDPNSVVLGTIQSVGTVNPDGTGTYNVNITISAAAMEIGPIALVGPDALPPGNDEYLIVGSGGGTIPAGFASTKGTFILGQTDGGNSGFGFTTVQGSTSVAISNATSALNGDWIMIPNGSYVGSCAACAEIPTAFFAQLSACSAGTCTMSLPADLTMTKVSGYYSPGVADGTQGRVWMQIDYDAFRGVSRLSAQWTEGRGESLGQFDVVNGTPGWLRAGVQGSSKSVGTQGFNERAGIPCQGGISGSFTLTPNGSSTGNDYVCSIAGDVTISVSGTWTPNMVADMHLILVSNGVRHAITFGTGFAPNLPVIYTGSTNGDEQDLRFVLDGQSSALWIPAGGFGPNVIPTKMGVAAGWPTQTVAGASDAYTLTNGFYNKVRRSNSGSAMSDTFPASTGGGMVNGAMIDVANADATATDTITAGSGTTINGSATFALAPGRAVTFVYDLTGNQWRPFENSATAVIFPTTAGLTGPLYGNGAGPVSVVHGAAGMATPSAPTPVTGTTVKMLGLGSTCAVTPATSGNVRITVSLAVIYSAAAVAGDGIKFQLRWGTGTAPVNGATATGTQLGIQQKPTFFNTPSGSVAAYYFIDGVIAGATLATPLWIDGGESDASANSVVTSIAPTCTWTESP